MSKSEDYQGSLNATRAEAGRIMDVPWFPTVTLAGREPEAPGLQRCTASNADMWQDDDRGKVLVTFNSRPRRAVLLYVWLFVGSEFNMWSW
jgi:hypothetical protein